jgi:hypothetical protein
MRKRAETITQRHSAHAAIFAKQLDMNRRHLGNGCTQPLPLTRPTELQAPTSDDVPLCNQGTTCSVVHGHAAGNSDTSTMR